MKHILLAYGLPKEAVAAVMILYRNTKVKVRSPNGDTDDFEIVASVQQGDTLAPYHFIISQDYVLRTSIDKIKEKVFELTKERSRRCPVKTNTNADYADDIALLANTPAQAKPCYIVWNEPLQALAFMSMHTKQNVCALIKQTTTLH